MSPAFSFNRENAIRVLKVFAWTMAAAIVTLLIDLLGVVEVPAQYAFIVPIVNTVLYAAKELVAERKQ